MSSKVSYEETVCVGGGGGGVIRESVVVRLSENENQYLQGKATFKMLSRAIQLYNLILLCSEGKLFSLLPPRYPPPVTHTHTSPASGPVYLRL